MKSIIDRLFPKDDATRGSNRLVQRGLEALRLTRDSRAVMMGNVRRTPSHLELRIASGLHEELTAIDAINDLAFHLKDELMKDLAAEKGRTFGDHTIHVTISQDSSLAENEIYAVVRNPERGRAASSIRTGGGRDEASGAGGGPPKRTPSSAGEEVTRVIGEEEQPPEEHDDRTQVLGDTKPPSYGTLRVNLPDGTRESVEITSDRFVIGRRGESGKGIPEGFVKIPLDLPKTVSREQIAVTLDRDGWHVRRIGSGAVNLVDGTTIEEGESRRLAYTDPIILDGVAIRLEPNQGA